MYIVVWLGHHWLYGLRSKMWEWNVWIEWIDTPWTVMTTWAPAVLTKKIVTTSSDYSRHRGRAFALIRVAD